MVYTIRIMENITYPARINRYLAHKGFGTRRSVEKLITRGDVFINDKVAVLGDKVTDTDVVKVKDQPRSDFIYIAYNKPIGVVTHSPQGDEEDIQGLLKRKDVAPIGRLDKASHGLIILTNDGRITDRLLNPKFEHDKEYVVKVNKKISDSALRKMESGVRIENYTTKPTKVKRLGDYTFAIVLTEGKRHQIRRMVTALGYTVVDLKRTRILSIKIKNLKQGERREVSGMELEDFLNILGIKNK